MKSEKIKIEKYEEFIKAKKELYKLIDEIDENTVLDAMVDVLVSKTGKEALKKVKNSIQRRK